MSAGTRKPREEIPDLARATILHALRRSSRDRQAREIADAINRTRLASRTVNDRHVIVGCVVAIANAIAAAPPAVRGATSLAVATLLAQATAEVTALQEKNADAKQP